METTTATDRRWNRVGEEIANLEDPALTRLAKAAKKATDQIAKIESDIAGAAYTLPLEWWEDELGINVCYICENEDDTFDMEHLTMFGEVAHRDCLEDLYRG